MLSAAQNTGNRVSRLFLISNMHSPLSFGKASQLLHCRTPDGSHTSSIQAWVGFMRESIVLGVLEDPGFWIKPNVFEDVPEM